jgi:hypothetical protein
MRQELMGRRQGHQEAGWEKGSKHKESRQDWWGGGMDIRRQGEKEEARGEGKNWWGRGKDIRRQGEKEEASIKRSRQELIGRRQGYQEAGWERGSKHKEE